MAEDAEAIRRLPMSVRMQRALDNVRQMTPDERSQLLVEAGLMTQAEADQVIAKRHEAAQKARKAQSKKAAAAAALLKKAGVR